MYLLSFRRWVSCCCLTGLGLLIMGIFATAQSAEDEASRWVVRCNNLQAPQKLNCSTTQSIFLKKSGQRIVRAIIGDTESGKILTLILPLGLDLEHGVLLSVDNAPAKRHSFKTADAKGTYAKIDVSDEFLNVMKAGKNLDVKVKGSAGRDIDVKLTLNGLANALELIARR